jgi:hypothetical protein
MPEATASKSPAEGIGLSKVSKFVVAKSEGRGMLFEEDAVTGMVTLTQPVGMAWAKSGRVCIIVDVYVLGSLYA